MLYLHIGLKYSCHINAGRYRLPPLKILRPRNTLRREIKSNNQAEIKRTEIKVEIREEFSKI